MQREAPLRFATILCLGLLMLMSALLVGCGEDDEPEGDCSNLPHREYLRCMGTSEKAEQELATGQGAPDVASSGNLAEVGTITGTGGGTEIRNTFRLGPLLYSDDAPPSEVLSSCLVGGSSEIASSVFAQGEVEVEYAQGSLPLSIPLNTELVQESGLQAAFTAYELDGEWLCAVEEAYGRTIELEPGESVTLPIWVVATGRLSNAQPKLPDSVSDTWYFDLLGETAEQEVSGPGKVYCEDESEDRLMLFNRAGSSVCS